MSTGGSHSENEFGFNTILTVESKLDNVLYCTHVHTLAHLAALAVQFVMTSCISELSKYAVYAWMNISSYSNCM